MIRYLKHIKQTWDAVLRCGHVSLPYSVIDAVTVAKLETLYSRHSASNKDYVLVMTQDHVLFLLVEGKSHRRVLLENITSFPPMILPYILADLFRDAKVPGAHMRYLEATDWDKDKRHDLEKPVRLFLTA